METIIDFLNMAVDGINGMGDQLDSWSERFTLWLVVAYLQAKLTMLEFAYKIASVMIESVGLSDFIESAWGGLDSRTLAVFTYLKIPEGLNTVLSAAVTRFVMDLLP